MDTEDKKALAEQAYRKAADYEQRYGSCPQCILRAVQETVGGIDDATIKAAHGLAGGGGLSGEGTCGALAGGLLVLSARFGRDRENMDKGRNLNNFRKCEELVARFRTTFGGTLCRELQQQFTGRTYNLWSADEYAAFNAARGEQCANATGMVARWIIEDV